MLKPPTAEQLREISAYYTLELSDADVQAFLGLIESTMASYDRLDQLVEPAMEVRYPRSGVGRPEPEENPLGTWCYRCSVEGAPEGPSPARRFSRPPPPSRRRVPILSARRA